MCTGREGRRWNTQRCTPGGHTEGGTRANRDRAVDTFDGNFAEKVYRHAGSKPCFGTDKPPSPILYRSTFMEECVSTIQWHPANPKRRVTPKQGFARSVCRSPSPPPPVPCGPVSIWGGGGYRPEVECGTVAFRFIRVQGSKGK